MSRSPTSSLGIMAAVFFAVLALVVFGLRPNRVVSERTDEYPYDATVDGDRGPVVVASSTTGGFRLLGFTIGRQRHTISVQFLAPGGCAERLAAGQRWPADTDTCATPFDVTGTVSGTGTTPDGRSLIRLDIDVSADCAATVELGISWPPPTGPCVAPR